MLKDSKYYYEVVYKNHFLRKKQKIIIGFQEHVGWGEEDKIVKALQCLFNTNATYISNKRVSDRYGKPLWYKYNINVTAR